MALERLIPHAGRAWQLAFCVIGSAEAAEDAVQQAYRVWKNEAKGGRWWFKHVAGGGGKGLPSVRGQAVPATEAGMRTLMAQTMSNDRTVLFANAASMSSRTGT
jgi:hypothetical protein